VRTALSPEDVLARCLAIERHLGRVRAVRWGPRTIDLDLLWADDGDGVPKIVSSETLTLPHPHLDERTFALAPLLDVRPDLGSRFEMTLETLGGRPERAPVEGWTSRVRLH
jgi:2-amino-4-hydroxy-6-hydroxymethyldihydropteridine diphosphokinase